MNKKPEVSVLLPIYNVEAYLARCLESIRHQTFREFEVICVDDGSTDSSGKICDRYANEDKRFHVIHKKNEGVSLTRQCALEHAIGAYILFVDPDDWIEPDTLEKLLLKARETEADVVICPYKCDYQGKSSIVDQKIENFTNEDMLKKLFNTEQLRSLWTKLIKHSAILRSKACFGRNINAAEDMCFLLLLYQENIKTVYFDFPFYHYCVGRENSLSQCYLTKRYQGDENEKNVLNFMKDKVKNQYADLILSRFEGEMLFRSLCHTNAPIKTISWCFPHLKKHYRSMSWPIVVKIYFWLSFHHLSFIARLLFKMSEWRKTLHFETSMK